MYVSVWLSSRSKSENLWLIYSLGNLTSVIQLFCVWVCDTVCSRRRMISLVWSRGVREKTDVSPHINCSSVQLIPHQHPHHPPFLRSPEFVSSVLFLNSLCMGVLLQVCALMNVSLVSFSTAAQCKILTQWILCVDVIMCSPPGEVVNQEAAFRGSHLVTCFARLGRPPIKLWSDWLRTHLIACEACCAAAQMQMHPERIIIFLYLFIFFQCKPKKKKIQLGICCMCCMSPSDNHSVSVRPVYHIYVTPLTSDQLNK